MEALNFLTWALWLFIWKIIYFWICIWHLLKINCAFLHLQKSCSDNFLVQKRFLFFSSRKAPPEVVHGSLEPLQELISLSDWKTHPVLPASFHPRSLPPSLVLTIPAGCRWCQPCSFSLGRLGSCPSDPVWPSPPHTAGSLRAGPLACRPVRAPRPGAGIWVGPHWHLSVKFEDREPWALGKVILQNSRARLGRGAGKHSYPHSESQWLNTGTLGTDFSPLAD